MSYDRLKPEDIERVQKLKQKLFKEYGKIRNFDELLAKQFDGSKKDMFTFLFDFENLSSVSIFRDLKFTERDIDEILCLYTVIREDNELDVDEALQFLIPGIYIKYLLKAYKQVKEMYFRNNKETMFVELEGLEKELKQHKAVVIGGHERWQQRMKEYLPNFIFIHPDQLNFDTRILEGVDTIFVYPNYLNHSMYYRVMNAIEGKNVKIVYLNQQNEEIVLGEIQRALSK